MATSASDGDLAAQQLERLQKEVVAEVGGNGDVDANFQVDAACCSRYLRARGQDHEAAKKMLLATIAWRRDFRVAQLVEEHFEVISSEAASGKMFVSPFLDGEGRPIMVMRPRNENSKGGHEGNIKHLVYQLERAVAVTRATESHDKWTLIIDFGGYSVANAPPLQTTRATLSILQDHYPERLFRAYLVDAPWLFRGVFSAISPFIDPVTRAKLCFVSSGEGSSDGITKQLPSASVERCLGGTADYTYSHQEYMAEDRARWEARQAVMGG